jgi:hypothetical protein
MFDFAVAAPDRATPTKAISPAPVYPRAGGAGRAEKLRL